MKLFQLATFGSLFMVTFLIIFTGTEGGVYVTGKGDKGPINGNVTLSCTYTTDANNPSLITKTWKCSRGSHSKKVIRSFYGSIDYGTGCTTSSMRGRVEFTSRTPGDASIRLYNISRLDAGLYICSIVIQDTIGGGTGSANMTLDVLVPVSNVKPTVTSPRKKGDFAEFTCTASGTSPVTYTLHKVGGVTSGDRWSNASGVFTLSNIQRADAGEYRCTADNEAKRPQTSDAVTLEVYYAPSSLSLTSSPSELTQQENSQVILTCTADGGHPAPDVTIYRDGVSKASGKSTATLTITLTKPDNQVALVCKATSAGITGEMPSEEIKYNVQFKPSGVSITQLPTSGVDVNTDVTLTCETSSSSNPPVSLGWTRDGSTVTDGVTPGTEDGDHNAKVSTSQLRFRAQKQNNGNVYVCRVTTMTHLTDQTTLNVMFPPGENKIQESPPGSIVVGNQKSLTCTTDSANPTAVITWTRGGQPASDHVVTSNPDGQYKAKNTSSTITMTTMRDHNGAEYACAVMYRNIETSGLKQTVKLDVTFAPVGVRMTQSVNSGGTSSKGSPVSVNSDVTLKCETSSSSNPPASLGWTQDGSTVTDGVTPGTEDGEHNAKVSTSQLRFRAQKQENGNLYVCRVTTMTHLTDQTTLNVTFPSDHVTLSESPPGPVRFGTTKSLTCSTDSANPAAQITWTRDGVTASDDVKAETNDGLHKAFTVNSTINIHTTRDHNQDIYTCHVGHMGQDKPGLAQSLPLNVTFPHSVSVNASVNPVVEGTDTILICQPSGGNPQTVMSYEWRGPSPIATKSSPVIGSANQLTLNNVTVMHAGKYDCSVTNMGGTGSNNLELIVLYTAKLDPRVSHQHKIATEYNHTVTFSLYVIALPAPTYNWSRFYNNETMSLLAKSVVVSKGLTSNLTIPMTAKTDMVTYICHVENTVGTEMFTFQLVAAAAPDRPSQPGIAYLSVLSVTLRWTAGFNGGFRQTFSVMHIVAGRTWPDEPQITGIPDPGENRAVQYKVGNLTSNTTYEFRVRAENERENGERTSHYTVTIQGKTKGKPTVVGNSLTVFRKPKSTVANASWAEPNGAFSAINISVCETASESCRQHPVNTSVSNTTTLIRELYADKTYTYILQLYDNGDLVYSSQEAKNSFPMLPSSDSALIGAVVGSLLAVLVIVVIVAVVFVYRRKHPGTSKKKDRGLINNTQRKDHTEFQNNGFVNNALEADIELGEDIDPGSNYAAIGPIKPKVLNNNLIQESGKSGLPLPSDGASNSAAEGALGVQDVGALYAEVQKPKKKPEDKVNTAPDNAGSQLYAEVDKKKNKKDKDIPTEGAIEAVSPVYAEVKKDKKKTKANENEGNNAEPGGPVYAEVKKDKKNKKKADKEDKDLDMQLVGAVYAEVKKENKNKTKEDKKDPNAEQMGPVYAEVKKDKKNKKKDDKKDANAELAGPVYAEVKKDKKDKKQEESRSPVPVAPVYEEVAKAKTTNKDKKAAEKSDKKGKNAKKAKDKAEDKKGKKMNTAGASNHPAGAYENVQIGEPSQSGAAAENAYQNFAEMQQDAAAAENTYQNMDEMNNQAAAPPLQFEQIRGPDGTLYEDPRNLEFGKKSAAGKPAIKPKPAQKPTEEPTEYAALDFTKKPPAPSGGGK